MSTTLALQGPRTRGGHSLPILVALLVLGARTAHTEDKLEKGSPWIVHPGIEVHLDQEEAQAEATRRGRPIVALHTHDCGRCRLKHEALFNHERSPELARRYVLLHLDRDREETKDAYQRFMDAHGLRLTGCIKLLSPDGIRISSDEPNLMRLNGKNGWDTLLAFLRDCTETYEGDSRALKAPATSSYHDDLQRRYAIHRTQEQLYKALSLARQIAAKLPGRDAYWTLFEALHALEVDLEARKVLRILIDKYPRSARQAGWRLRLASYAHLGGVSPTQESLSLREASSASDLVEALASVREWARSEKRPAQEVHARLALVCVRSRLVLHFDEEQREGVLGRARSDAEWIVDRVVANPDLLLAHVDPVSYATIVQLLGDDVSSLRKSVRFLEELERKYGDVAGINRVRTAASWLRARLEKAEENAGESD